ncbi:MAG: hypothetical protein GX241_03435 [Ruminococcaceae bacterium]|nr:hypothetical protein [Oscillospiraceae bacterium]
MERNNNSSIYAAKDILNNSYICSSDNYFSVNPFELEVDESYYAAIYAEGKTEEWCMHTDKDGYITDVQVGGENAWYMLGHAFWDENFTKKILKILLKEYNLPETADLFWENIFVNNISEFKMKLRKYDSNAIYEFDTLDELRIFDKTYIENTRSKIMKCLAKKHNCSEGQIVNVAALKGSKNDAIGFEYQIGQEKYKYIY